MIAKSSLKGTALVTGGARRIGRGICLKLSKLGFKIALHYNQSQSDAQRVAKEIRKKGGVCELFHCNLLEEGKACGLIEDVRDEFHHLDVLINNASIFKPSSLRTASCESFNNQFSINLKAPFILTRDFAQHNKRGHIINILDTNIVQNKTHYFVYLLTKKALYELTKLSALELAPGIRVNAIAPGLILPPFKKNENYLNYLTSKVPLKKRGQITQITQAIEFLLNTTYLTGQILYVDGGQHLI